MFQKDGGKGGSTEGQTVIGPSVKVEGDLKGIGNLLIEGSVKGNLSTDQDLTVGDEAVIEANVSANNASIAGKVTGGVTVKGHLSLKATAKIDGDVQASTLEVQSGAQINGRLTMGHSAPAPQPAEVREEVAE